ncbi:MAG: N-acetyl-gamma-glutamyl-phosphate reductase [Campylobacterota bacterium]|nr:N-acetyl-gamma-glutamyl-phosphate reductase [Campylobacterota bacterium]
MNHINVGIVGASGYTGLELLKLLINHKYFKISYVATTEGGVKLSRLHPSLSEVFECDIEAFSASEAALKCELLFLALPHQVSMNYVKELSEYDVKIVDLSADYRLELDTYEKHYCLHVDKPNLQKSVYGLPELFREEIASSVLVANPGCYPTASILAIQPFLNYMKKDTQIIIDAKSGVSGAGKKCSEKTHYVSINENHHAYAALTHRHAPEIAQYVNMSESKISFVPHLLPTTRGMLCSIYMSVEKDIDAIEILKEYYINEPFVRIRQTPVDIKSVGGTNYCDIFATCKDGVLFVSSAIDNLLRGASSQALVNANLMMGIDESESVPFIAYVP